MEVTEQGNLLTEERTANPVVKGLAVFFSYLFHPLFLIAWVTLYLLYLNDSVFLGADSFDRLKVFLRVFSTSVFLPLVTVLLLKGLGFIQSIQLHTQRERIVPYIACITFFFWSYYVSKTLNDPVALRAFLLALFVCACAALIMNNYFKVSMHGMGAGALFAFFVFLLFTNKVGDSLSLAAAFLSAAIICTSRLIAGRHHPFEIYFGFFWGVVLQAVCWFIVS
jgi:hypothetical protein